MGTIWKLSFNKVAINYGKQLNDRHINHVQVTIKNQIGIKGLQLTLYQHTGKLVENRLRMNFKLFIQ